MGVPKFYRWISERYPKINQIVTDNALLPEFDHLYLDMNGIIHGCTHPPDQDVSKVISEKDMLLGILHYLDRIITQIVRPKVSVYMAIDGVAPRAKLNQQRSRRFRSAQEMAAQKEENDKNNNGGGDGSGGADVFDSNCITPGTPFLAMVSETIRYWIRQKCSSADPVWHNLTVIFSGHDIPGEGEHKIMQHIRSMKEQPHYQPNTRHCIYGQDADLIMLGLVTHEPHFTILREVIDFSFGRGSGSNALKEVKKFTKESDFQLLHLSILREYLAMEFCYDPVVPYDLERCLDDFVFLTFLVGNDFLPHMPTLDIGDGAFDLLFTLYTQQRGTWPSDNPYLTNDGEICDPHRLEGFLAAVGSVETEILIQKEEDDAVYLKKRRKWDKRDGKAPSGPTDEELAAREEEAQQDYLSMVEKMLEKIKISDLGPSEKPYVEGWSPITQPGEKDFKGRYYFEKMKMTPLDKEDHWKLRKAYMEGLIWCLAYYYKGCISWGWFYPYHYGPMLSDLIDVPRMFDEIKFEIGTPLTPFQQLMGCLPPASAELVPKPYRWLMMDAASPILHFYPKTFEVDMNGKKNPWEGVNILPFIDVDLLKKSIADYCPDSKLSEAERQRNVFGNLYAYRHNGSCSEFIPSPNKKVFPDVHGSHSSETLIEEDAVTGGGVQGFKAKLMEGTKLPYPGFPSLNVLPMAKRELIKVGLNCFGSPSKYHTMMLTLTTLPQLPPLETLAQTVLERSLFVNWPMMHEGRVVAISDAEKEIRKVNGELVIKKHSEMAASKWMTQSTLMQQMYFVGNGIPGSGGIDVGEINIRLKLLPLQGMKTNPSNGAKKKVFGQQEADVPLQLALWQAPAPDPRFQERGPLTLQDRFPDNSRVLVTKGKYRGCKGTVLGIAENNKSVAVKVETVPAEIPFGLAIARSVQESFVSSYDAARILKMNSGVLGKIMGRLQFEQGRYDLGLNLKNPLDGTCVVGYTRKKVNQTNKNGNKNMDMWAAGDSLLVIGSMKNDEDDDDREERIQWEYTPKAIRLIETYRKKFPQLFSQITKYPNEKKYNANVIFGPNGEAWLPVIREWLNSIETAKLPRTPVSTESMSYEAVAAVQKAADVRTLALKKKGYPKDSVVKIPGNALFLEGSVGATDVLSATDLNKGEAPELGDRIVNLIADGIPFGARGTVVGIHEAVTTGSVEVVMDEEFVGGTSLQGACSNFRGKLCQWGHLLKIAPDNSKDFVDKMVPKGQSAISKIISHIDPNAAYAKMEAAPKTGNKHETPEKQREMQLLSKVVSAPPTPATSVSSHEDSKTPPKARGASTGRTSSSGRAKQGAWREARGPPDKGTGFKGQGKRKGSKSGLVRWRDAMKNRSNTKAADSLKSMLGVGYKAPAPPQPATSSASAELKGMLGIASKSSNGPSARTKSDASSGLKAVLEVQSPSLQTGSTASAEGLKAMLGVGSQNTPVNTSAGNEAALKAMLGVGGSSQAAPPGPPSPPSNAAEQLMRLMAGKEQQTMQQHSSPMVHAPRSGFNFTYVEEGAHSAPPVQQAMIPVPSPYMQQQYGMHYPTSYGMPPPAHMLPQPHFSPHPMAGPPAQGPSMTEYPPLGASGPPPTSPQAVLARPPEEKKPEAKSSGPLVPSVVLKR